MHVTIRHDCVPHVSGQVLEHRSMIHLGWCTLANVCLCFTTVVRDRVQDLSVSNVNYREQNYCYFM